jgi:hypothetical protein
MIQTTAWERRQIWSCLLGDENTRYSVQLAIETALKGGSEGTPKKIRQKNPTGVHQSDFCI